MRKIVMASDLSARCDNALGDQIERVCGSGKASIHTLAQLGHDWVDREFAEPVAADPDLREQLEPAMRRGDAVAVVKVW